LAPMVWFFADLSGLSERFDTLGVADESANARIIIFQVFALSGWRDLVFGAGLETLTRLSRVGLKLQFVENSIIVYVFQFGFIGTAFLVSGFVYAFYALCRRAVPHVKIAVLVFLLVALSANTLSTKTPDILLIFTLAVAFGAANGRGRGISGSLPEDRGSGLWFEHGPRWHSNHSDVP
jgi:polysaccharide biosynthesis protein VpsF